MKRCTKLFVASVVAALLIATLSPSAYAETIPMDAGAAIETAADDPSVQDRLALRPHLEARATRTKVLGQPDAYVWIVRWYERGAPDDEPKLSATVDPQAGSVQPAGQSLVIMPGRSTNAHAWLGSTPWWIGLSATFALCVIAAIGRGAGARHLVPLAVASAIFVVSLLNVVPREHLRGGNVALFGGTVAVLAIGSLLWIRAASRPVPSFRPRLPVPVLLVCLAMGGAFLVHGATVAQPIDVAYASDAGARLSKGGVPVYGNVLDMPGVLIHGDTYGPVAYFAYIPGVAGLDQGLGGVIWTNVALVAGVAMALFGVGIRRRNRRAGLWAAATWVTCPAVAIGAVAGNNDVVVAATLTALLLCLHHPVWRGAMLAVAGCTKFLPIVLGVLVLRLRGESRADAVRFVAGVVGTIMVLFLVALRGVAPLEDFWKRAIVYQFDRDDIASFWGLTGTSNVRYVFVVAAIVVAFIGLRQVRSRGAAAVHMSTAATLALLMAALPQFWWAYVTWLVPPVLIGMLDGSDADPGGDRVPSDVQLDETPAGDPGRIPHGQVAPSSCLLREQLAAAMWSGARCTSDHPGSGMPTT
ncbi:MAG: hypothetical protein JWL76_67 [Thermoleophilia bacterium]|nr:hypothetical protein [Thermoleophilia bacterium]